MFRKVLPLAVVAALACEKPGVAPGLDQPCDGGVCSAPGVIQGSLVYSGTARGDAILLLFDTQSLPPPDGTGSSAAAVARIPSATLFANAAGSIGPFSAPFVFTQVPAGRSYQVRAFLDVAVPPDFDPFFDFTQQPRAGAPVGGYGALVNGVPKLVAIPVAQGQVVTGINVALTQTLPYDPPSFVIAGGSQVIDVSIDQPVRLQLQIAKLSSKNASFANAHFGLELDLDAQGNRQSTAGDGLDDVFPRVFLRQLKKLDGTGVAAADAAIVPCRAIGVPVLPALLTLAPGAAPIARDTLDVFVAPLAVSGADLSPLPRIPAGVYQVIVIEKSGQVWTLPNRLGDPSLGTDYFAASQAQTVTFDSHLALPPNSISGNVVYRGDPSIKSGNILVQAYLDDPTHPPPPLGAARPVRVQLIRATDVVPNATGFSAPYRISGLPSGNYLVQGLDALSGTFGGLAILQTPVKGDLVGAVLDSVGSPASIAVGTGETAGREVTLAVRVPTDPPAFEIVSPSASQMPADQVTPVRFDVQTKALAFPIAAAQGTAPHFAVQLVRDAGGAPVDRDGDGLPDVWPRAFLVRLNPDDPTRLSQFTDPGTGQVMTEVIPAAVDPTPFLPALKPVPGPAAAPVLTDRLTIVVRPVLLDATAPLSPPRRMPSLLPGAYKLVLISQTGQAWQIPNEAGSAALDPSVVCAATAPTCALGTVKAASQSQAFQVGPPAHQVYTGSISGTLTAASTPLSAYVFAYSTTALPPFGRPLSADVHFAAEFSGASVSYALPNLPTGDYVVVAIADTRGDFAVSPALFALAPGAGTLLGSPQTVHVGTAVASANLAATSPAPVRPSFQVLDFPGGTLQTADVNLSISGNRSFQIQPAALLTSKVVAFKPDASAAFFLACGASGPDPSSLSVQLVKVRDAAGVLPDVDGSGNPIVAQASVDLSAFAACSPGVVTVTSPLKVTVPSGMASGRYAVMVTSIAKQVWRVPNELQPALMDAGAYASTPTDVKSLLQTQQVAVNIGP
jgi:hypothetical protein